MNNVKSIDRIGERFGRLIVESIFKRSKRHRYEAVCICDCGNHADIVVNRLVAGKTKSCGCLRRENSAKMIRVNGTPYKSKNI